MARYNVKRAARELQGNPLLPDLLHQMQADILAQFETASTEELLVMQIQYRLIGTLQTMIDNAIYREAGTDELAGTA